MYAWDFLALHFAFDVFGHIQWGVKKPTIVLNDNKTYSYTQSRFHRNYGTFVTKRYNLAHVSSTKNLAAESLSHQDFDPQHKIQLKLTDRIPVYCMEIGLAAKTLSQNDDETDCEIEQKTNQPMPGDLNHINAVLQLLCPNQIATDDQIAHRQQQLSDQLSHKSTWEQHYHFIRFQQPNSLRYPAVSQVSPQGDVSVAQVERNARIFRRI